ncbi:putative RNA methyltransferase [Forsythia ovata]|uniref:RNA methyltransferase n=1 Tax=Forsythia ovata TaxID=205694 RepID=A0ABD1VN87_9LAMI
MVENISDEDETGGVFHITILSYLETPQYLRKGLFPSITVRNLLHDEPGNTEYLDMEKELVEDETINGFFQNPLKNIFSGAKKGFSDVIDGSNKWVCVLMVKDWWPIATGFRRRLSGLQPRVASDIWCCMKVEMEVG